MALLIKPEEGLIQEQKEKISFLQSLGLYAACFVILSVKYLYDQYAKTMGRTYGQNAIVWCDAAAGPELVLLR